MNILALDGSLDGVQIVIHDDREVGTFFSGGKKTFFFSEKEEHVAEKILFFVQKSLQSADMSWKELEGIIMISGPGSFTSLRLCGMSAKILAHEANIPFYAFSHFDAERLRWQNVWEKIDANQQFLLVHPIHQNEWGYCLLDRELFFDDTNVLYPKTQRVENIGDWMKDIVADVDEKLPLMLLGQSAHDFLRHLRESVEQGTEQNWLAKKIVLPVFPPKKTERETFLDLNGLIDFILQCERTKDKVRQSLYRVDARVFEPHYVGGFWKKPAQLPQKL